MQRIGTIFVVLATLAIPLGGLGQAAPLQGGTTAKPDLTGVWTRRRPAPPAAPAPPANRGLAQGAGNPDLFGFTADVPSMTPWAEQRYKLARAGRRDPFELKAEEPDPALYPYCMPSGFPRAYTDPFPFRIVQTPDILVMIFEYGRLVREIHLDGRKHMDGAPPTFLGDSIGHWDGDTLVVETVNIHDVTYLDNQGHPHSDALRIVERIRRPDRETLEIDFLFEDPKAYTRPWTGKKIFRFMPTNPTIGETITCERYWMETYLQDLRNETMQGRP